MISHSSPIVQANMVYSGSYETPSVDWPADQRWYRGHLTATRVYMPDHPMDANGSATNAAVMWDAGAKLAAMTDGNFSQRKIYFPDFTYGSVTDAAPEVCGRW